MLEASLSDIESAAANLEDTSEAVSHVIVPSPKEARSIDQVLADTSSMAYLAWHADVAHEAIKKSGTVPVVGAFAQERFEARMEATRKKVQKVDHRPPMDCAL